MVENEQNFPNTQPNAVVFARDENALLASGEMVILQTATCQVPEKPGSGQEIDTCLLFDIGANRSYCSEHLAQRLNLKMLKGPDISVNRFGTKKSKLLATKTAKLLIMLEDGKHFQIIVNHS